MLNHPLLQSPSRPRGLLDRVGAIPLGAWSCTRLLRRRYTGNLINIIDTTTSVHRDIGQRGGYLDVAAMLAFLGGHTGQVGTIYDQSGNGKDLTSTNHPRIVNAGTVDRTANGTPTMVWSAGTEDMGRSDALGLTGSPALTVLYAGLSTVNSKCFFALGEDPASGFTDKEFAHNTGTSSTAPIIGQNGSFRTFTSSAESNQHYYIAGKATNATPSAFTLEQDGSALSQASVTNGSTAMNMSNQISHMGHNGSFSILTGNMNLLVIWNAVLSGNDLAYARGCGAAHI